MRTLVECVPNFSEGRNAQKVEAIIRAILDGPDVHLLDQEMDADHNRSVITIVGTRERVGEAALRGIGMAAELIDLNRHRGGHPRIGATDVVPFVPIEGVTLDDCARIAEQVAAETWRRFRIPTYLYEAAARVRERQNLENIRRGQFEGLRDEVRTHADRCPDFGEAALHPTAGATIVGARKFLIAYNINLNTSDVALAQSIARKIRTSSGGFPCVKAMGVELGARNLAQVSMNLTDFETTSLEVVYDAVARGAAERGITVVGSEIVGLVPRRALEQVSVHHLKIENFQPEMILENRLAKLARGSIGLEACPDGAPLRLQSLVEEFVNQVAAGTPTPGGGSVAALAGALAAALGEMVCRITLKKASFSPQHETLQDSLGRLTRIRERLLANIDCDAKSFEALLSAFKLHKATESEQRARAQAIEAASQQAAAVPLETAQLAAEVERDVEALRAMTAAQAAPDLTVALQMAEAARLGAIENVRANLPSIRDREWLTQIQGRLLKLESEGKRIDPEAKDKNKG